MKNILPPKVIVEMDNLRAENAQLRQITNEHADALIELSELIEQQKEEQDG